MGISLAFSLSLSLSLNIYIYIERERDTQEYEYIYIYIYIYILSWVSHLAFSQILPDDPVGETEVDQSDSVVCLSGGGDSLGTVQKTKH